MFFLVTSENISSAIGNVHTNLSVKEEHRNSNFTEYWAHFPHEMSQLLSKWSKLKGGYLLSLLVPFSLILFCSVLKFGMQWVIYQNLIYLFSNCYITCFPNSFSIQVPILSCLPKMITIKVTSAPVEQGFLAVHSVLKCRKIITINVRYLQAPVNSVLKYRKKCDLAR